MNLVENKNTYFDNSTIILIISNIIVIILAIIEKWNIIDLLLIYWAQSMIIGFFHFLRMINHQNYVVDNKKSNLKAPKILYSIFFLFHYGWLNLFYLFYILFDYIINPFLFNKSVSIEINWIAILIGIFIFLINHLISYIVNYKKDILIKRSYKEMMFLPYIRIVPMDIILFIGAILSTENKIIVFLVLKLIADIVTHKIEHKNKSSNLLTLNKRIFEYN